METYLIYRDGEEVEVSWFEKKLDDLRRFWQVCEETDWLHYFRGNGPGESVSKEFTGFHKLHNQRAAVGQWTICVKGGIRPRMGAFYYRSVMVEGKDSALSSEHLWPDYVKWRVLAAEGQLDFYQRPECTCRVGFHRRCPFHCRTQN